MPWSNLPHVSASLPILVNCLQAQHHDLSCVLTVQNLNSILPFPARQSAAYARQGGPTCTRGIHTVWSAAGDTCTPRVAPNSRNASRYLHNPAQQDR